MSTESKTESKTPKGITWIPLQLPLFLMKKDIYFYQFGEWIKDAMDRKFRILIVDGNPMKTEWIPALIVMKTLVTRKYGVPIFCESNPTHWRLIIHLPIPITDLVAHVFSTENNDEEEELKKFPKLGESATPWIVQNNVNIKLSL